MKLLIVSTEPRPLSHIQQVSEERGNHVSVSDWIDESRELPPILIFDLESVNSARVRRICEKIRSTSEGKEIAILTVGSRMDINRIMLKAGSDDFICNPFDRDKIDLRLEIAERIVFQRRECNRIRNTLSQSYQELEKRSTQILQETHRKRRELEEIVTNGPAVAFLWRNEPGWPVEFVSENVSRFGYKSEDFYSGKFSFFRLIHSNDRERITSEFQRYQEDGLKKFVREYRIITHSGDVRWLDARTWARLDSSGLVTHYQGILLDITERKQVEKLLRKRTKDLNDRIKELNGLYNVSRLVEKDGVSLSEIFQGTVELLPPAWQLPDAMTSARIRFKDQEFRSKKFEESAHKLSVDIEVYDESEGGIDLFYKDDPSRADLTFLPEERNLLQAVARRLGKVVERIQAERALKKSEAENRALLNVIPDMMFRLDKNGVFINARVTEESKLATLTDQFIGKSVRQILPRISDQTLYHIARALQTNDLQVFEYQLKEKDFEARIVVCGRDEVLAIIRDITDRKQTERALEIERTRLAQRVEERTAKLSEANAKLARSARLKDEFLANMSHELRTPLNTILGLSEVLHDEVYGEMNKKEMEILTIIEESGQHLLALINDILDLSKIGAGKLELDIRSVGIKSVCEASLRFIKQMAIKKNIKIHSDYDPRATSIQADERRLKQILVNLLTNAVKFTPDHGSIGLEVVGDARQQAVLFTIWDTGIGISQEDMSRLFEPFTQLDSRLSRRHPGTGLGLSLVYKMVTLHGGGISAESEVGKGSRFTVRLLWQDSIDLNVAPYPIFSDKNSFASLINPKSSSRDNDAPLVMVVDDNEAAIDAISIYLRANGYRSSPINARNGKEALERVYEKRPDLVLIDIQMPQMDGLATIRRIRGDKRISNTPIIAVTALAMEGDRECCLAAGANEYFSKPVSLAKLTQTIKNLVAP